MIVLVLAGVATFLAANPVVAVGLLGTAGLYAFLVGLLFVPLALYRLSVVVRDCRLTGARRLRTMGRSVRRQFVREQLQELSKRVRRPRDDET